jgi:hypothetical protein
MINYLQNILRAVSRELLDTLSEECYGYVMPAIDKYIINVMKCFVDGDIDEYLQWNKKECIIYVDEEERNKRLKEWYDKCEVIEDEKNILSDKYYDLIYEEVNMLLEDYIKEEWKNENN